MGNGPKHAGRLTLPREVREAEDAYIRRRRGARKAPKGPKRRFLSDTIGLALSGGGIRSATFCLGFVQSLAARGLWRYVDYLSTVSGGGYTGSCASSLCTRPSAEVPVDDKTYKEGLCPPDGAMPLLDRRQIHHLRTHGDFLIVRKGLFKAEFLRSIGNVLLGLTCSLLVVFSLFAFLVGALLLVGGALAGNGLWDAVEDGHWNLWRFDLGNRWFLWWAAGALFLGALSSAVILLQRPCADSAPVAGENTDKVTRAWLVRYAWVAIGLPLAVLVVGAGIGNHVAPDEVFGVTGLLLPLALFLGSGLAIALRHLWLAAGDQKGERWTMACRSRLGGMQGIVAVAFLIALLCVGLAWLVSGFETLMGEALPYIGLVALVALRAFAKGPGPEAGAIGRFGPVLEILKVVILTVALVVVCVAATVALTALGLALFEDVHVLFGVLLVGGTLLFVALTVFVDFNRVSPHYFYRDRLSDAYLRTTERVKNEDKVLRDDSGLRLHELHLPYEAGGTDANRSPYHLILSAVNLPGSDDLARKDRQSDHFVFSRFYCGASVTGYVPTHVYANGHVTLAKAMTISGAAAASNMGFYTTMARAIALTMFNIRLGYWLPNPRKYDTGIYPDYVAEPPPVDGGVETAPRLVPRWWGGALWREMTCQAKAKYPFVNLSDGGHTGDNLGLYPLLQRRCKVIIACDAERDPAYDFPSLASAIRQINTDENVRIEIQPDEIRPDPDAGGSPRHFVVGRIHYPECPDEKAARSDGQSLKGWLLYVKSSFHDRAEPTPVKSYARRNEKFPHQPTTDLFFDDDQFEAYRGLGEYIGRVLDEEIGVDEPTETAYVKRLDAWCKKQFDAAERRRKARAAP